MNQKARSDAGFFHSNCALVPTAAGAFDGANILRLPKAAAQRFKITAVISTMTRCEWGDPSCASLIILSPPSLQASYPGNDSILAKLPNMSPRLSKRLDFQLQPE